PIKDKVINQKQGTPNWQIKVINSGHFLTTRTENSGKA
ncbi:MAG: hypothetical protein ACI9XU_001213, partial [Arenicella sp.]